MKRRRPILVWILIVVFTWSMVRGLHSLFSHSTISDYQVLAHVDLGFLFLPMAILLLVLDGAGLWFLAHPRPAGFWTVLAAFIIPGVYRLSIGVLALRDLESARAAYARSREIRGLPVREEALDFIFSTPVHLALLAGALLITIGWIFLLVWGRRYFQPQSMEP